MTKGKGVAPATENTAPKEEKPSVQPNGEDLTAMSEAIARQAEVLAQADEKIATLEAENLALKAERDALKETVKELNEEIANQETENAKLSKRPSVKVGKDTYELPIKKCVYMRNGVRVEITKEVLDADPALAKELAEKNNGVLVKKGGK